MAPLVHIVDPSLVSPAMAGGILTAEEKERAARFHFEADRVRWSACRTALRIVLAGRLGGKPGSVPLHVQSYGKPYLPAGSGLEFNLSHCHDLALIATCLQGPLGIDLEPRDRAPALAGCEETFCHPAEIAALPEEDTPRHAAMLRIWTAKEAFLKALGTGLSYPPTEVIVDFAASRASSPGLPALAGLILHPLSHPLLEGHLAALACPDHLPPPRIVAFP